MHGLFIIVEQSWQTQVFQVGVKTLLAEDMAEF